VPLARNAQGFSDLADIERVEVLRGPQGTLFGKNSTGGVINIVTKAPSREFQSTVDMTAAQDNEYRVRGSVSGPLSDTLSYRVSTFYNNVGGITENVTTGHDVDGLNSYGLRTKLRWDASDRLTLNLIGDFSKAHADCCSSVYLQVNNPLLTQLLSPVTASMNNDQSREDMDSFYETRQATGALEVNYDLGGPQLTSLTSYQSYHVNNNQPIDGLNTPVPISLPVTNGYFDINGGPLDLHQFSQEVRVSSSGEGAFKYTAGLFYLDMSVDRGFIRRSATCAPGGAPATFGQPCIVPLWRSNDGFGANTKTKNAALFAQGDLKLFGDLSGIAGVRVQHEKVSFSGYRPDLRLVPGDLPLVGVTPSVGSGETSDTASTGKLGLKYEFSRDAQAYLTWSTGYKGAGYNVEFTSDFANNDPVKPEHAKAWELGYKAEMFDGRVRMDTAVFYAKYRDLQVQANRGNADLGIVRFVPTNAGSSVSKGVEVEFTARPLNALTLNGGVTYLLTSVDINGLNCPLSAQAAAPVIASGAPDNTCYKPTATATPIQNVSGGVLPNAPRWRGTLNATFDRDIPGTQLGGFVRLGAVSQSKMNFVIEQDPLTWQGAYTIVDASIGLRDQNDKYRVSLFVDNLFDRHYVTLMARAATLTTATVTPNQLTGTVPKDANRYFGITASMSF
jgi:iron complex outermembrane receptor protein